MRFSAPTPRLLGVPPVLAFAIILYMTTLPVAEARAQLSKLVEEAASTHERFEITRNGQRVAVLLGAEDYDALRETIAVLADSELLRDHLEGTSALERGESMDKAELADAMRAAGRLSTGE
jgi:antitoxin YefM